MNATSEDPSLFSDLILSRRLETAEARSNIEFVEARATAFPESGAQWIEVAGAYAIYDGVTSPLTQTFGLGLFQTVTNAEMNLIEEFYRGFGAPVFHEVSPLAEIALVTLLNERDYHPIQFTSVMFRPISRGVQLAATLNEKIQVRLIKDNEQELWAQTSVKGWSEFIEFEGMMFDLAQISARRSGALSFIAELEGQPIATGGMFINGGVALMSGASTIPEGRKQGAQLALLESRLRYAAESGCDIAMICVDRPGSASQRNAERQGFRIAYTRVKWQLA